MGMALDQALLVQPVEHAHQRDRLDIEHRRHRGLAQPLVAGNIQERPGLLAGDRQSGLPGAPVETAAERTGELMTRFPESW